MVRVDWLKLTDDGRQRMVDAVTRAGLEVKNVYHQASIVETDDGRQVLRVTEFRDTEDRGRVPNPVDVPLEDGDVVLLSQVR